MEADLTEAVGPAGARAGGPDGLVTDQHAGAFPVSPMGTGTLRPTGAPQAPDASSEGHSCPRFQYPDPQPSCAPGYPWALAHSSHQDSLCSCPWEPAVW